VIIKLPRLRRKPKRHHYTVEQAKRLAQSPLIKRLKGR
jgi:hypothetical protein